MLESAWMPYQDVGLLILRVAMGILFVVHGWPKLNPNSPIRSSWGWGRGPWPWASPSKMLVAAFVAKRGFMKVPFVAQQTTGWELDFILLAASMALLFLGAGSIALDSLLGL